MPSVLFVCLGNICRSPMAEGIFRAKLAQRGLDAVVDSAGTGAWHAGEPPDPRTLAVLDKQGAACEMTARQVVAGDFERFDLILAMDRSNLRTLQERCPPGLRAKLHLALEPTTGGEVGDPYYGGASGFDRVYAELDEALDAWLDRM
jgi:protein-tyrosine phosphatase